MSTSLRAFEYKTMTLVGSKCLYVFTIAARWRYYTGRDGDGGQIARATSGRS